MANTEPHVDSAGGSGEVMDRWKTDNCESGGDRLSSRSTSLSRRLIGLAGVAALTVGGAGAVLLSAGSAYAATPTYTLASNDFSIGSSSVGGVTFAASSSTTSATSVVYTYGFTIPSGFSGTATVTPGNLPGATTVGQDVVLVDNTAGTNYGVLPLTNQTTNTAGAFTIPAGDVTAGDTYTAQVFGYANSGTVQSYNPTVALTGYLPGSASTFTLTAAATTPTPSLTLSNTTSGLGGVTYTFSNWKQSAAGTSLYLELSGQTAVFPTAVSQYTVTDTPSGGTAKSMTVSSVSPAVNVAGPPTGQYVDVTLATTTAANDTLNITVTGVQNPTTSGFSAAVVAAAAPTTGPASGGAFSIGNALASASLSVSPTTVAATNAVYSVSFTLPAAYSPASTAVTSVFTDSLGASVANTGSWAIFDSTTPVADISGLAGTTATIPATALAGDSLTVDYYGVTNTSAASVSGAISLASGYTVPVTTNTVDYTAASTSTVYPTVTVSNPAAGGTATYTISGLVAGSAGIPAGTTLNVQFGTNTTANAFPLGSVLAGTYPQLPTALANYTLTDLSTSSGSGLTSASASVGGVALANTNAINAGDKLQLTITGVINQGTGTNYAAEFAGFTSVSQPVALPSAAVTYPNGAFVQSGAQIDVVAGGVGFGIPTMTDYQQIAASDSSAVVAGSFPTATAVRTGTLLKVLGSPAIYVVGTNGEAYPFSTPTEFSSDGYSAMSVVNVPSLGSLTVGSGTAPTAAVTMPDGALVQSGSTIYVYAGGVAFGIPTFANYQTIAAATGTTVVQGTVSNTTGAALTSGTLVQPIGSAGIYVSYGSSLYQFSTASQFSSDGYNGANVVPVPSIAALTVA